MSKRIIVFFLIVLAMMFSKTVFAELPIDISGSTYETQDSTTVRMRNLSITEYPGKYWVDFRWDSSLYVFVPVNAGAETIISPLEKANLLIGTWHMIYKMGSTSYDDVYILKTVQTTPTSAGNYGVTGTDKYGRTVVAMYYPDSTTYTYRYALLNMHIGYYDDFYIFDIDATNTISGKYCFVIPSGGTPSPSSCYALIGYKDATAHTVQNSATENSDIKNIYQELYNAQ